MLSLGELDPVALVLLRLADYVNSGQGTLNNDRWLIVDGQDDRQLVLCTGTLSVDQLHRYTDRHVLDELASGSENMVELLNFKFDANASIGTEQGASSCIRHMACVRHTELGEFHNVAAELGQPITEKASNMSDRADGIPNDKS